MGGTMPALPPCLHGMRTDRVTFTVMMAGARVKAQCIVRFAECEATVTI